MTHGEELVRDVAIADLHHNRVDGDHPIHEAERSVLCTGPTSAARS